LVALYFAIEDSQSSGVASDEDREEEIDEFAENAAAVFAMNPHKVNHAMHADIDEVVDVARRLLLLGGVHPTYYVVVRALR